MPERTNVIDPVGLNEPVAGSYNSADARSGPNGSPAPQNYGAPAASGFHTIEPR
jgi:hypothetical protein